MVKVVQNTHYFTGSKVGSFSSFVIIENRAQLFSSALVGAFITNLPQKRHTYTQTQQNVIQIFFHCVKDTLSLARVGKEAINVDYILLGLSALVGWWIIGEAKWMSETRK